MNPKKINFDPEKGLATDLEQFPPEMRDRIRELVEAYATPSSESEDLTKENSRNATTDSLTGVPNRRSFEKGGERIVNLARREKKPQCSILMLDIDHFKIINDQNGHPVGDKVLKAVAKIFQETVRRGDLLARYGGEEFVVVLPRTDRESARELAERIRLNVARDKIGGLDVKISIGVADIQQVGKRKDTEISDASILEKIQKLADDALYAAKETGRNRVCVFTEPKKVLTLGKRKAAQKPVGGGCPKESGEIIRLPLKKTPRSHRRQLQ